MRSRRIPYRVIVPMLLVLAFAPGIAAREGTPSASPAAGEPVTTVALITPDSRTNQGWDQQAADAIEAVAEERGIEAAVVENAGYDDITPVLNDLADDGARLIICHASGYQTICPEFAQEENVRVSVVENPNAVTPGLISDVETEAQEVAYLAGVLAGRMTTTGTVGVVVSDEPPTWNYMTVGFAEGLKASNPDAKLLYSVIGVAAYADAAGGKRVTEQQIANGADVIFGQGDGASFGMIQAIEEHNADEPDNPVWFIDVIGDKREQHGDVLLTSVLFDYTGIFDQMIADIEAGTFGQVYTLSLENEGVRLLDLPDAVPQEVKDAVEEARQGIVDGSIEVSAVPDADGVQQRLDELFPG
ncbi:MAG: BMP family protein [Thermomicrobiales bacterium]